MKPLQTLDIVVMKLMKQERILKLQKAIEQD
jgi:hypothetical protein